MIPDRQQLANGKRSHFFQRLYIFEKGVISLYQAVC